MLTAKFELLVQTADASSKWRLEIDDKAGVMNARHGDWQVFIQVCRNGFLGSPMQLSLVAPYPSPRSHMGDDSIRAWNYTTESCHAQPSSESLDGCSQQECFTIKNLA